MPLLLSTFSIFSSPRIFSQNKSNNIDYQLILITRDLWSALGNPVLSWSPDHARLMTFRSRHQNNTKLLSARRTPQSSPHPHQNIRAFHLHAVARLVLHFHLHKAHLRLPHRLSGPDVKARAVPHSWQNLELPSFEYWQFGQTIGFFKS